MPFAHRRSSRFTLALLTSTAAACGGGTEPSVPSKITLDASDITLDAIGRTRQLSAAVTDQRGDPFEVTVTWNSDNNAVATVSPSGLVTAQGSGQAQVTVSAGQASAIATVSVAQTVTTFKIVSGDNQANVAGTPLPLPLVVEADDPLSHPIAGLTVIFSVAQGGGNVDQTSVPTGADGRASTILTVGPTVGAPQQVMASVPGSSVASLTFQAIVTEQPTSMAAFAGEGQSGPAGAAVAVPPAVRVLDANHHPVPGVLVSFQVTAGGGSVTGGETTSNANGVATAGSWSLGPSGINTLAATAVVHDLGGEPVRFVATTDPAGYNVVVRFLSSPTSAQRLAFAQAETRWESLVTGELADVPIVINAGWCGQPDLPALSETIDDLLIFAELREIDGPGKTLGAAGPCLFRTTGLQALAGIMFFDVDDLDLLETEGVLDEVVLHEMGHVLGFGTLWGFFPGLLAGEGGSDPHFTGAQATAQFDAAGGTAYDGPKVPVENMFGPGTRDSHWRESVFDNELMTGFIELGRANPLSKVTVGSLADMGYVVDLSQADAFTCPACSAAVRIAGGRRLLHLGNDVIRTPVRRVDATGRIIEAQPR